MTFTPLDPATWGPTLTLAQVAQIWQTSPHALRQQVSRGRFVPAPMLRTDRRSATYQKPLRWRTVDVKRHLGLTEASRLRRVG